MHWALGKEEQGTRERQRERRNKDDREGEPDPWDGFSKGVLKP